MVTGERLSAASVVLLGLVATGVVLAATTRNGPSSPARGRSGTGAPHAVAAAVLFGLSLYATARASADLPLPLVLLPARLIGVAAVAVPLAVSQRLRLTRRALPLVVVGGLCEVAGFAAFSLGSRHGIAVSAVLASQFGAVAAVAAYLLFAERLSRVQLTGVVTIVVGVAALTALQP